MSFLRRLFRISAKPSAPAPSPPAQPAGDETPSGQASPENSPEHSIDLVSVLAKVLEEAGHLCVRTGGTLLHQTTGMVFRPSLVNANLREGTWAVATTVETVHVKTIPGGVYEYQHSVGGTLEESVRQGFEDWIKLDLSVLTDLFSEELEHCTSLTFGFPEKEDQPARDRRVLLGPCKYYQQSKPKPEEREAHPFCPCCLFTHCDRAFKALLETEALYAIRFFASRDTEGNPSADCRVNGEPFEAGAEALREYIQTWPDLGFEFRKQYVIIQTTAGRDYAEAATEEE